MRAGKVYGDWWLIRRATYDDSLVCASGLSSWCSIDSFRAVIASSNSSAEKVKFGTAIKTGKKKKTPTEVIVRDTEIEELKIA